MSIILLVLSKLKSLTTNVYNLLNTLNFLQGALFLLGLFLGYKLHTPISLLLKLLRIL